MSTLFDVLFLVIHGTQGSIERAAFEKSLLLDLRYASGSRCLFTYNRSLLTQNGSLLSSMTDSYFAHGSTAASIPASHMSITNLSPGSVIVRYTRVSRSLLTFDWCLLIISF